MPDHEQVFAYTKIYKGQKLVVVLNFKKDGATYHQIPPIAGSFEHIGNYEVANDFASLSDGKIELRPWEAVVISPSNTER